MSQISVNNLTFGYDGGYENIFEDVSFIIDTDWRLGFCGRNGRGKTTFLNLLLGKYSYSGSISGPVDFEYFPYEVSSKEVDTIEIVDNITDGCDWRIFKELSLLKVDSELLYRSFNTLSNGEQTKVLLAALFCRENSFLLIDEPTNHLDVEARQTVADYLNSKSGFILVSHDRAFLDSCIDHTLSINRADIEIIKGNFSVWYEHRQRRDAFELAENEKLKKDIKRLKQSALQKGEWADAAERRKIGFNPNEVEKSQGRRPFEAAKAKASMKRMKAIEKRQSAAITEKESLLKNLEKSDSLKLLPLNFHSKRLIEFKGVSLSYGERKIFAELTFNLNTGDRLAIRGKNGCGKTSIIKLIMGEDISHEGDVYIAKGLQISYVSQNTSHLHGSFLNYEQENGLDSALFRAILRKLDFSRLHFEMSIDAFSEGQKKKLLLAHSLATMAHLYIWDEPLNYIDILSRIQIEQLIQEYSPTMIFVEHDSLFCENVATVTVDL